ncbi:hypothetical protein PHYPSEUDO_000995 [Phytophthora pseudosyringae]|uniref:Folate-Biopterin Transporter (FBT) family n=1 Tax=Phytophthora pseudosyringae TaxID=221518 RepID=A0A8T1W1J7_9STRA|nr:hypothetical protein PHYPSEUDO_000995 [Phytophthora pseudosyringae]
MTWFGTQRASTVGEAERASACRLKERYDDDENMKAPRISSDVEAAVSGALRGGGAPNLFTEQHVGLVLQYAAVGLVYGVLPSTIYPFMQAYLNASGAQVVTASTLVVLPWSFKVFYGVLSDCFPLFGYRRRPYMIIGWTICVAMLLAMGCSRVGRPYFLDPSARDISPSDYTPEIEARLNRHAVSEGGVYVVLMMFAAFGYVLADVCADGVVVELAQREPIAERGRTQSTIYATRTFAATVGQILTGVAFNGEEYGGSFDFSLTFPQLMMVLAACTAPIIPVTWLYIEEVSKPPVKFSHYVSELWQAMKTRAVYQVVFYSFFSGIFANFSFTAGSPIQLYMVGVTPINNTISDIIGNAVFLGGIILTGKYGLDWNWRTMTVLTGVAVIAVDAVCTFITVWDVFRSQWFWLGLPIAVNVPAGVSFLIGTFVTVELVGEGHEGAMYGLLTTVANLSSPFAATLTKVVDSSLWDLSNERVQVDDDAVRRDITEAVLFMYGMSAVSWLFLFLLPRQKQETQELKQRGGSSAVFGALTVGYLVVALIWSVTTNIMGIFPGTSCLVVAGGSGC